MNGEVMGRPSAAPFMLFLFIIWLASLFFQMLYFVSIPGFFKALGLSPKVALALALASILGSFVNIPIKKVKRRVEVEVETPVEGFARVVFPAIPFGPEVSEEITIAVNLGGCLIPVAVSGYLIAKHPWLWPQYALDTAVTAIVSYLTARVIPGVGIAVPVFLPALVAAVVAVVSCPHGGAASVAYVGGTLGTLIGADVMNLRKAIRWAGAPVLSIGGAGTFDAIFIAGITAVWIAFLFPH